MPDRFGPIIADSVIHRPTQVMFRVTRRSKDTKTGLAYLWNHHIKYLLQECRLQASTPPDHWTGKTFLYAGYTAKLQKQFSDVQLTVLQHNGVFAQCKGGNQAYYTWVPLQALKPI